MRHFSGGAFFYDHLTIRLYLLTLLLCHFSDRVLNNSSERSEKSRYHKVGVTEILPPYGRLNDTLC